MIFVKCFDGSRIKNLPFFIPIKKTIDCFSKLLTLSWVFVFIHSDSVLGNCDVVNAQ